jgi:hypothetical protein
MKKLIAVLIVLMALAVFTSPVGAAPFLVCDPQEGVTHYKLTGPAWMPTTATWQPGWVQNNKLFMTDPGGTRTPVHVIIDVSAALLGITNTTLAACGTTPEWGEQCSSTVPFSFTRPAPPLPSTGVKLVPLAP